MSKKTKFGEWQLCPKCNGQGYISSGYNQVPPYITYTGNAPIGTVSASETATGISNLTNVNTTSTVTWSSTCDVCNGAKIIQRPIIK